MALEDDDFKKPSIKSEDDSETTYTTCPSVIKTLSGYGPHSKEVHSEEGLKFTCALCNKGYVKKSALGEHMSAVHRTSDFKVCNICNLSFTNRLGLEDHMSYDHKIKIEENSDLFFSAATDTKPFIKEENKEYLFDDQKCTTFNCKFCDEILLKNAKFL